MFNKLQNVNIDCVFKWIILCVGFTSDNAGCAYLKAENTNNNNNKQKERGGGGVLKRQRKILGLRDPKHN